MLLKMFLIEEYRRHIQYGKKFSFFLFPIYLFIFTILATYSLDKIMESMGYYNLIFAMMTGIFMYGLSVGAFGLLGQQYLQRRFHEYYLVSLPEVQPLSYKFMLFMMFVRDLIYYLFLFILPFFVGLMVSIFLSSVFLNSVLFIILSLSLAFLLGMSISFFFSVVFVRNKVVFGVSSLLFGAVLFMGGYGFFSLSLVIPSIGLQVNKSFIYVLLSLVYSGLCIAGAYYLVPDDFSLKHKRYRMIIDRLEFRKLGRYSPLFAKELTDIIRGDVLRKIILSYFVPIIIISFATEILEFSLNVTGFNTLFFAIMLGFMSTVMYSWLNNLDVVDYYNALPIKVTDVIKVHMISFLLISVSVSTFALLFVAYIHNELHLYFLSLLVMVVNSIYVLMITAYLTGLRTNSMLFNTRVISRFMVYSIVPNYILVVFAMTNSFLYILIFVAVLLVISFLTYKVCMKRWESDAF